MMRNLGQNCEIRSGGRFDRILGRTIRLPPGWRPVRAGFNRVARCGARSTGRDRAGQKSEAWRAGCCCEDGGRILLELMRAGIKQSSVGIGAQ